MVFTMFAAFIAAAFLAGLVVGLLVATERAQAPTHTHARQALARAVHRARQELIP